MNKIRPIVFVILVFASTFFAASWLQKSQQADILNLERLQHVGCDPSIRSCVIYVDQHRVTLSFIEKPSPLTPFTVLLETDLKGLQQVALRFYMPDMDMGYNAFELFPQADNHWQNKIVLPVCSQAQTAWRVELQLISRDRVQIADFAFQQI